MCTSFTKCKTLGIQTKCKTLGMQMYMSHFACGLAKDCNWSTRSCRRLRFKYSCWRFLHYTEAEGKVGEIHIQCAKQWPVHHILCCCFFFFFFFFSFFLTKMENCYWNEKSRPKQVSILHWGEGWWNSHIVCQTMASTSYALRQGKKVIGTRRGALKMPIEIKQTRFKYNYT